MRLDLFQFDVVDSDPVPAAGHCCQQFPFLARLRRPQSCDNRGLATHVEDRTIGHGEARTGRLQSRNLLAWVFVVVLLLVPCEGEALGLGSECTQCRGCFRCLPLYLGFRFCQTGMVWRMTVMIPRFGDVLPLHACPHPKEMHRHTKLMR